MKERAASILDILRADPTAQFQGEKRDNAKKRKEYSKIDKKARLAEILSFLANYGYRTRYVFACIDLCRCISQLEGAMVYPEGGLVYSNGKHKNLIIWHDIHFYEIYHPSRSPRISTPGDSPS